MGGEQRLCVAVLPVFGCEVGRAALDFFVSQTQGVESAMELTRRRGFALFLSLTENHKVTCAGQKPAAQYRNYIEGNDGVSGECLSARLLVAEGPDLGVRPRGSMRGVCAYAAGRRMTLVQPSSRLSKCL